MFSFVIERAVDGIGAVLLVAKKSTLGLNKDNVDDVIAETDRF